MNKSIFNFHQPPPSDAEIEWLGGSFIAAISFSILGLILWPFLPSIDGIVFMVSMPWITFVFMFLYLFVNRAITIYSFIFGTWALLFIGKLPWYYYLGMPFAILFSGFIYTGIGIMIAILFLWIHKINKSNKGYESEAGAEIKANELSKTIGQWFVDVNNRIPVISLWGFSVVSRLIVIVLLFSAFAISRYEYFTILRWVVSVTCIYTGLLCVVKFQKWILLFLFITILFNPLYVFRNSREIWIITDWITAVALLYTIYAINIYAANRSDTIQPNENNE